MADRLYYHDSFLREFDALVLACEPAGERYAVTLDRTAFYPTSGGQPHDVGTLGDAQVVEVLDNDAGGITHFADRALAAGAAVHGAIDWSRRFDHMQQHTGQHILSAAFVRLFQIQTVSFHLGRESSAIDLAARSLDERQIEEAEPLASEVIFGDAAVEIRFVAPQELAALSVRKEVKREGQVRVISIGDFDRQPCGGTHVGRSGQIGLVLLRKVEKQKGNWRVEFVCGGRALRAARGDYATLGEAASVLSVGRAEVPTAVQNTLDGRAALYRGHQQLQEQLAAYEALALFNEAAAKGGAPVRIVKIFEDADAAYLRLLATKIVANGKARAFLGTRAGGHVIFAQSPGLDGDMNVLLRQALQAIGGKGGGSRDFAQGSVADARALDRLLTSRSL